MLSKANNGMGRERRKFVTRKASVDLHSGKGNACAKKRTRKCATFPTKKISFLLSPPPSKEGRARRNNNAHISHVWHVHITIFFSSPVLFFSTHTHTHTSIFITSPFSFLPRRGRRFSVSCGLALAHSHSPHSDRKKVSHHKKVLSSSFSTRAWRQNGGGLPPKRAVLFFCCFLDVYQDTDEEYV